jgi:ABC-type amino acid transport substrate-binding protein
MTVYSSIILTFSILLSSFSVNACKLIVHVIEYPPLAIEDDNNNWSGLNFKYLDALFDEAECKYTLYESPFARGIKLLKSGKIDLIINLSKTPNREKYLTFIGPQRQEIIKLITKKGTMPIISDWKQFSQLDNIFIWQTGAYFGEKILKTLNENNKMATKIIYLSDNNVMVDLVTKGRADGFFAESLFFEYQKKNNSTYKMLEAHPLNIHSESVYFAFSKKSVSPQTINKFQQAYKRLIEKNILQEISL